MGLFEYQNALACTYKSRDHAPASTSHNPQLQHQLPTVLQDSLLSIALPSAILIEEISKFAGPYITVLRIVLAIINEYTPPRGEQTPVGAGPIATLSKQWRENLANPISAYSLLLLSGSWTTHCRASLLLLNGTVLSYSWQARSSPHELSRHREYASS
ncbi:hypothetical protein ONS95_003073 [Cadophora gregata]|uniref:uncharacterized protein n=1 Tax=Cadophora gregata TaxID=51156 RepID=UPI0026DAD8B3|nr:uncharacterized protein ONS95_003073 [Cadophora gregata]KAK0108255.1 hypothetical protein ONS95_003073 [Cadophora gregata]